MRGIEKTKRQAMDTSFAQIKNLKKQNGSTHYAKLIHME